MLARHRDCVGCLLLTGTPMKNGKPCNIYPLLKCIRHPLGENQRKFEARYCDGQYKQYGRYRPEVWDAKGATNLAELHDKIGDYMLRKTKEECLDLKGKSRRVVSVAQSVPPKGYAEYR